jgi:hypothetical protein
MPGYAPRGVPATPIGGSDAPGAQGLADVLAAAQTGWNTPDPGVDKAYQYAGHYGFLPPLVGAYDVGKRALEALGGGGAELGHQIGRAVGSDPLGGDLAALLGGEYPGAELPGVHPYAAEDRAIAPEGATKPSAGISPFGVPIEEEMHPARRPAGGPRPPRNLPRAPAPEGEMLAPPRGHNLPPELLPPETPPAEASAPDTGPEGAGTPEPADVAPKSIRQNIEEALAAQEQKGATEPAPTGRRAITNVKLRDLSPEEATAIAQRGDHLIQDKTGQYVGAPRGVDTPEKLQAMRDNFDAVAATGIPGRMWYPQSRSAVTEITGGDPARSRLAAGEMGLWSPQSTPPTNFGAMLQGHNAYEAGAPLDIVRTGQQARTYLAAREAGGDDPGQELQNRLAKKTGPFAKHLDPTQASPTTSVNDIWHARGFGYTNKDGGTFDRALTPQEHSFLDAETLLAADRANQRQLGGFTDWGSGNIQASAWVGARARKYVEEDGLSPEAAMAKAKVDFGDVLDRHTAAATYEQTPGAGVGHARAMVDAPYEERAAYGAQAPWTDPRTGEDVLYRSTGLYQRPTLKTQGYYTPEGKTQAEVNPAFTARPMIDYAEGEEGEGRGPSDVSRGTMDAVEATRAYFDAQEMGAHHKLLTTGKAGKMDSVHIPYERSLDPDEMTRLGDAVKPFGLSPFDTGRGVSLLNFGDGPKPNQMQKALKGDLGNAIRGALPDTVPERAQQFSNALLQGKRGSFMAKKYEGTGTATRSLFRTLDNRDIPAMAGKLDTMELRQAALQRLLRDEDYARRTGDPIRADIQNARRIVAESGLTGLRQALKEGKIPLPAVAGLLGAGGALALGGGGEAQAAEGGQMPRQSDNFGAPLDYSGLGADTPNSALDLRPLDPAQQALAAAARRHMMARMLMNQGEGGDTMLAHINPREAVALKMMGGSGTINPATGLPEFQDSSDDGSGGLGGGVGGPATDYGHANAPTNQGGNFDRAAAERAANPFGGGVIDDPAGLSVGGFDPTTGADLGAAALGPSGAGLMGGASGAYNSRAALGDPTLGDPTSAIAGPLAGSPIDVTDPTFVGAQTAFKNRGILEHLAELGLPGYEATAPDPNVPASYAGGTYHSGVNPVGLGLGLVGSALAGPIGGLLAGKLGGWGYDALGGSLIGSGGNLFGGGGTSTSPGALASAGALADTARDTPGGGGSDMSSGNPHVNAAYGTQAGTYPMLGMGQTRKDQKDQQARMYKLARLGLLMQANRAV